MEQKLNRFCVLAEQKSLSKYSKTSETPPRRGALSELWRYGMRQFGAVLRNSTLAQLTARSGVRQNFLGGSDKRRTAPNCRSSLGGALMARDEQLPRLSYTTTLK